MFTLTVENKYGEQMELTHNDSYVITSIEGIDPPQAVINTTRNANADGSIYNSAYVDNRTITITLAINAGAEDNRILLYRYFKAKYPVKLNYQNASRNVYINGFVQNIDIQFFNQKQIAQITILCPDPFFVGTEDNITEFSSIDSLFEFPFSIEESANLLPYPYYQTSRSDSGLTYTDNGDGTITVNGTNTATGTAKAFVMRSRANENFKLPAGTYILSGGLSNSQRMIINYEPAGSSSAVTLATDTGSEVTFTVTEEISQYPLQVGLYSTSGATYDDVTIYPMIRAANVESDTWEQYNVPDGLVEFSTLVINEETNVYNGGDVETGALITLQAAGAVKNPSVYNVETNEYFVLDNLTLQAGDVVRINTIKKQKSVTLLRDGVTTNLIGNVRFGSTWFQLAPLDNTFIVSAEVNPENMYVTFMIANQFEGV